MYLKEYVHYVIDIGRTLLRTVGLQHWKVGNYRSASYIRGIEVFKILKRFEDIKHMFFKSAVGLPN